MANKVKYGLKNVHYAKATIDSETGAATYATPVKIPGAVNLTIDPSGDSNSFFADNIAYATFAANAGYEGSLEVAMIPDSFLQTILGEVLDSEDKIQYEKSGASNSPFALLFEFEGDDSAIKHVLYNVTATRPSISSATTEESIEVQTETLNIKCSSVYNAALEADIVKGKCVDKTATSYANWYTAVQQKTVSPEPGSNAGTGQ